MKNVLIITGGGSGIGQATGLEMGKLFDLVILVGRNVDKLKVTKERILKTSSKHNLDSVLVYACDLAVESNIVTMVQQMDLVLKGCSSISLINNAGIYYGSEDFADSSAESWQEYFQINLMGAINLTRLLLPYMKAKSFKPGVTLGLGDYHCIVNVASTAGTRVISGLSAYGSLKAALIYWSKAIALELGPKYIRVNVVAPGLVDTPIHDFYSEKDKSSNHYTQANKAQVLQRIGQPKDVAEAIKYLCTTPWVTGSTLTVDGGISI